MTGYQLADPVGGRQAARTLPAALVGLVVVAGAALVWGPAAVRGHDAATDAVHGGGADPVARFLLAVAVVVLVCHLCGELLRRLRQPPVLGEILGGLMLGPSLLGWVWPSATRWLFQPDVLVQIDRAAQLGLVIFMFLLGCELRTENLRGPGLLGLVVAGSIGLPMLAGMGLAVAGAGSLAGSTSNRTGYVLFVGLALAMTALPVLARILVDLRMESTPTGAISLAAAAVGDGVAWTVLAVVLATTDTAGIGSVATTTGLAAAFVLFVALCVRPVLAAFDRHLCSRRDGRNDQMLLAILVVGAIGAAAITQLIGLHPVIGAFLFGIAVPRRSAAVRQVAHTMQGFAVAILLPLFFGGVGLRTSVALLDTVPSHWLIFAGMLLAAISTKIVGAGGGARLAGLPGPQALQVGILMNCRGVTELVVATIGLQYGLISPLGFTVLVLVAVITTAATGPLVRLVGVRSQPSDIPVGSAVRLACA